MRLREGPRAALPVRRERLPAGALQRGQACDPEVRRSRARSHRLRAVVGAARPHGKLCVTSSPPPSPSPQSGQLRTGKRCRTLQESCGSLSSEWQDSRTDRRGLVVPGNWCFLSFCTNAWTRARRATDRDLESVSAVEKMNAWICALLTTDRDLESSNTMKRVNALDVCIIGNRS